MDSWPPEPAGPTTRGMQGIDMTPKERVHAIVQGQSYDRPAVTPIFMAWAAHFIDRTYRDYYLDADVLAQSQLAVAKAFNLDQVSGFYDQTVSVL